MNSKNIFKRNRDANHAIENKTNGCLSISRKYENYNPHSTSLFSDDSGVNSIFYQADDSAGYNNFVSSYTRIPDIYGE